VTGLLLVSVLIGLSGGLSHTGWRGQAFAESEEYILEAENASGGWLIGPFENSVFWEDAFTEGSYADGAYVTPDMPAGVTSSLAFTPPAPGYYLIGLRMFTREDERDANAGMPTLTLLLQDEQGQGIPNELEAQAKGYTRALGLWDMLVMGLWNLPAGPTTITFQSGSSRFVFLDYFFLSPVFMARGSPCVFLPVSPWPAEGNWTWGQLLDWMSIATDEPGATASIPFEVPVAGEYAIYVSAWHDGAYEHLIDFQIGENGSALSAQLSLSAGTYWQAKRLGVFSLPEGETRLHFTSNPRNPPGVPVAIASLFIVPRGPVATELPFLRQRERGAFRTDGLMEEWKEVPTLIADPQGDQALSSDIRRLKAAVADGFLYVMVEFHTLAERPGFELAIDLDGNHEPEYVIEGGTEGRWFALNYPGNWLSFGEGSSAAFEVIEFRMPLSLLDRSIWKKYPESLPPDFDVEGSGGFYIRYSLLQPEEPRLLDETDWGYVEVPK
jgi:hypothetical protein